MRVFLINTLSVSQWLPSRSYGLDAPKETLGHFPGSDTPRIFINAHQGLAAPPYYFNFAPSRFSNAPYFCPGGQLGSVAPVPHGSAASSTSERSLCSGALPGVLIMLANNSEKIMLISFFHI